MLDASDHSPDSTTRRRIPVSTASERVPITDDHHPSEDMMMERNSAAVGPVEIEQGYPMMMPPAPHQESHVRSLVKGLTWRIVATTTTTISEYHVQIVSRVVSYHPF